MVTAEFITAGLELARGAAQAKYREVGERDACGFGWVEVRVTRTNSKQAKELIAAGFRKSYKSGCLDYWDPAGLPTQSISVKEAGADAYAGYLKSLGLDARGCSRMD